MNQPIDAAPTPEHWAVLTLPRLRVQNANAISSPMTWGFPAMSAFLGFMTGLERRLGPAAGISFRAVGVVCHDFEAQVTTCPRRSNIDPPCRFNIDPGMDADRVMVGCG